MADSVQKRYNIGLALLKLWMCYEVVMVHFWSLGTTNWKVPPGTWLIEAMRAYAVPVFMLTSFFLAAERFRRNDGAWLRSRFVRLVVPFASWSLISFAVFAALSPFSEVFKVTFRDLGYQLALGTTKALGSQMWFQAVLIILTAFFAAFFRLVRPRHVAVGLLAVFAVAEVLDYTGLNKWLFEGFCFEVRNPLGRVFPMMPYAVLGLIAGTRRADWAELPAATRMSLAAAGALAAWFFIGCEVFVKPPGFYYCGLKMFAVAASLFTAFHFLPLERLPGCVHAGVAFASRFSMGVYFAHIFVGRIAENFLFPHMGLAAQTFKAGCVVFLLTWLFCLLASLIPCRWTKLLLE